MGGKAALRIAYSNQKGEIKMFKYLQYWFKQIFWCLKRAWKIDVESGENLESIFQVFKVQGADVVKALLDPILVNSCTRRQKLPNICLSSFTWENECQIFGEFFIFHLCLSVSHSLTLSHSLPLFLISIPFFCPFKLFFLTQILSALVHLTYLSYLLFHLLSLLN